MLVANRGEIARRVIRTAKAMGVRAVAVYSEADAELPFVEEADEALPLGPAAPAQSYLNVEAVLAAAKQAGVSAIHPGYGFLSENADFARRVIDEGLIWVGPDPAAITTMGDKVRARNLMAAAGVPVAPGTPEPPADAEAALQWADKLGYPVMVKAAGGGGGIGMAPARDAAELRAAFQSAKTRAERFFGTAEVLLERYVPRARHVEVQILGLADGRVIALGERECSVQRRHQKVAEEAPAPLLSGAVRGQLRQTAVMAGEAVGYLGAGTVEMLLDSATGEAWFLEMNTRLQVEHPVTEMTTGIDLVQQQLLIAAGEPVSFDAAAFSSGVTGSSASAERTGREPVGWAIEFRVYAEDPKRFFPGPGLITEWVEPEGEGIRVDSGYRSGNRVTQFYDPLLAKLVVHGKDRDQALQRAREAVAQFRVAGPKHNLPFFGELLEHPEFVSGSYDTGLVARMRP